MSLAEPTVRLAMRPRASKPNVEAEPEVDVPPEGEPVRPPTDWAPAPRFVPEPVRADG